MRNLALALFLFSAPIFAAQTKQTLGARSAHHELRLERSAPASDQIAYNVVVLDLDSGKTVLSSPINGKPEQAVEVSAVDGTKLIRVRLSYTPHFFSANLTVVDGKTILDEFRTWWQLEPHEVPAEINAPGALRVGGDVKAPIVISRVEAIYTDEARKAKVSGIVILEALVDKTGHVKDVAILKPLPFGLDQAAVDAVKQWVFKPGTLNGQPVDVIFNLTVNFRLDTPPQRNEQ